MDETDTRPLNPVAGRAILRRGQTDSFLMATPRPLGQLQYLRVWHDNSGRGDESSWFLNYIILKDLQTGDKFHFVANRWLAVDEDDGEVRVDKSTHCIGFDRNRYDCIYVLRGNCDH